MNTGSRSSRRALQGTSALDEQMADLQKQMEALGDQIEELARPMVQYAKQMEPLAARLGEMGKQIKVKVAEAEARLRAIAERAIADGKAERP